MIGHYERDGEITIGGTALDSPSEREIARQERMKREAFASPTRGIPWARGTRGRAPVTDRGMIRESSPLTHGFYCTHPAGAPRSLVIHA
jgi:hypothetical protein